jgi:hypothetical protein
MELILNFKKSTCLPHVSSIFKKSVLKLLDRTIYIYIYTRYKLDSFVRLFSYMFHVLINLCFFRWMSHFLLRALNRPTFSLMRNTQWKYWIHFLSSWHNTAENSWTGQQHIGLTYPSFDTQYISLAGTIYYSYSRRSWREFWQYYRLH